ncbi:1-deoxy-D-xylulose-5-phosphate synthase [Candidatus Neomarinimicrobiota bacterium]
MQLKYLLGIKSPHDLRQLKQDELSEVVDEIRDYTISTVTEVGGHLASTLGVIELTVALHYVYNTPDDKLIWDVGHQGYAHKILTGRFKELKTIRQSGGLSGFLKPSESEYDVFGAGHASTSISAGIGLASARDHLGDDYRVVSIIGDGAMTGGLAYEGLNNAGHLRKQILVILNDNEMSISPNVGAIRSYLTRIVTNPLYNRIRDDIWKLTDSLPKGKKFTRKFIKKIEESLKNLIVPGILFDELGFRYFGPIDGHDIKKLVHTLENIKDIKSPVLLHIVTKKGKGMNVAEEDPITYHGVKPRQSDDVQKPESEIPSFQSAFGSIVCEIAKNRADTTCITAAMREGTGLVPFAQQFPKRYYDVGIAEGHAVTFAGGLAISGVRPIVAIYSTFLQRAYDQIIHDIALQKLPVIFCLDRSGLAGEDGPTHHGNLDIAYMSCIPDLIVSAPKNGNELRHLIYTALNQKNAPFSIRYPKSGSIEFAEEAQVELLPIGDWEVTVRGNDIAILAVGPMVYSAEKAAIELKKSGASCEIVNCRFIKPMDEKYLQSLVKRFENIVTIEEGSITGGFGSNIAQWITTNGYAGKISIMGLPDAFVRHGSRNELLQQLGLDSSGIVRECKKLLK